MKIMFLAFAIFAAAPALAVSVIANVPEMDGALFVQFAALAGGLALLLKKKKR